MALYSRGHGGLQVLARTLEGVTRIGMFEPNLFPTFGLPGTYRP
ncbi:hypothetical protein ACTG9Q_23935 [Actinokineospora sp. 24-640]